MSRPNLLLAFADQLRADACSPYGNTGVRTQAMERMAATGVTCRNAIANIPCCGPMRASMFTGAWPGKHRVVANDLPIRTDLPTLGTCLRDAGYRTGYVGKWHLDGVPRSKFTPPGERRLGFDYGWAAYNCAHDYFRTYYFADTPQRIDVTGYEPQIMTDLALAFIDEADERPWAMALSLGPPHDPYPQVPQHYRDLYNPAQLSLRPNVQADVDNPLARGIDCRQTHADYYAAVTALDDQLNRLLNATDNNTIVMFTSDHGDMLWSHGWMKKQSPYEESVHVPILLRGPGLQAGQRCQEMIGLLDLTPTLLGLCGIVPPRMLGRDLSASVRGGPSQQDAVLMANPFSTDEGHDQGMPEWRGVRTASHTYIERSPGRPWLLFDNVTDPFQQTNLAQYPAAANLCASLGKRLAELLRAADDPFQSGVQWLEQLGLTEAWSYRKSHVWS